MENFKQFIDDMSLFLVPHKLDETIKNRRTHLDFVFDTSKFRINMGIRDARGGSRYKIRIRPMYGVEPTTVANDLHNIVDKLKHITYTIDSEKPAINFEPRNRDQFIELLYLLELE